MSQTVNFPGPFDSAGRLICWRCFGPTIHRPSGQPGTLGKIFYKCQNKPGLQCERFFKWQEDVDQLRLVHGVPDPDAQPTPQATASAPSTMVASAPSTPAAAGPSTQPTQPASSQSSRSQPSGSQAASSQASNSQATGSQPVPGRTRTRPDIKLNATPVITPQRHLSRRGTAETVVPPTTAPVPTTPSRRPAPSPTPSPPPQVKTEADDEAIVETNMVDDDYTNVTLLRTPRSTGRIYPALPSTQGSSPDNDGSPVARKRPRSFMPGAFTDSTDSPSPTATGRNREIREWQIQSSVAVSPMADRPRDVFSSPPPTQDTAPAGMSSPSPMPPPPPSTPSRASASTASRMHGLLASSSPAPTQATIRVSEPGSPSIGTTEDVANRLVQDAMLLSRRTKAAEASANYKASYIKELEEEKQKLLEERATMQAEHARAIQEMQKKLTQAYEDISKLQKKLSSR